MLLNLMIGLPTMVVCLAVQAAVTAWCVRYYMQPHLRQFAPLLVVMLALIAGNFAQVLLWGVVFMFLGEFTELYEAVYHSGVNFSSLGYGDVVMSKRWKLLGPLEAANGVVMFAMTGAALMAILQHMIKLLIEREQGGQ